MADSRIIPAAYLSQADREANYNPVTDDCVCAQEECDECNPGPAPILRRSSIGNTNPFVDNTKKNMVIACHDNMTACWNAWDLACKYEHREAAQYYMDLLALVSAFQKKLQNLKEPKNN